MCDAKGSVMDNKYDCEYFATYHIHQIIYILNKTTRRDQGSPGNIAIWSFHSLGNLEIVGLSGTVVIGSCHFI